MSGGDEPFGVKAFLKLNMVLRTGGTKGGELINIPGNLTLQDTIDIGFAHDPGGNLRGNFRKLKMELPGE